MNKREAEQLLARLGAPDRLVAHVGLVGEALEEILTALSRLGIGGVDLDLARAGVVLHDVGKVQHPAELDAPGHEHETTGELLLLEHGVEARVARICRTHADWRHEGVALEELLVALADKLWKGKRVPELEERVLARLVERAGRAQWDLFVPFDDLCERVAAQGPQRLERSRGAGQQRG